MGIVEGRRKTNCKEKDHIGEIVQIVTHEN